MEHLTIILTLCFSLLQEVLKYFQENGIILSRIDPPLHQNIKFDDDRISLPEKQNIQEGWALRKMFDTTVSNSYIRKQHA